MVFAALENLNHTPQVSDEDAEASLLLAGAVATEMQESVESLQRMDETLDNLTRLQETISSHGISRGLVAFADQGGVLSSNVAGMPAIESLTADIASADPRTGAANEGLVDMIRNFVTRYVEAVVLQITTYFKMYTTMFSNSQAYRLRNRRYWDSISDKSVNAILAKQKTTELPKMAALLDHLKIANAVPNILKDLWTAKLPTTEAEFGMWVKTVQRKINGLSSIYGTDVDDSGKMTKGDIDERYAAVKGTFEELGYDQPNGAKTIYQQTEDLITVFRNIGKLESTMKSAVKSNVEQIKKSTDDDAAAKEAAKTIRKANALLLTLSSTLTSKMLNVSLVQATGALGAVSKIYK